MSVSPNYDYYNEHGGKLSGEEFAAVVREAEYTVSFLTLGRSESPPESMVTRVKDCICAVCDEIHSHKQTDELLPGGISSINNDGYSVTRNADGIQSDNAEFRDYIAICKKYLTIPYNLMYMGVC